METLNTSHSIDFFVDKLNSFITDNHPDARLKMGDDYNEFLRARSDQATEEFSNLIGHGTHFDVAMDIAMTELKAGFLFSKYNFIDHVMNEFYPERYESHRMSGFFSHLMITLVSLCDPIFATYDITDDFIYDDRLEFEIKECIQKYI